MSPRKFLKFQDAYSAYAEGSTCRATVAGHYVDPDGVMISFKGPVAKIPSLKNEKIRGKNILRPEASARLRLASDMVQKALGDLPLPVYSKNLPLFCLVLCAYRPNAFDEDNVGTTVKDWFEPRIIRKHDRGWGLGIVPNDKEINIFTIKKKKSDAGSDSTDIYLCPLSRVLESRAGFMSEVMSLFCEHKKFFRKIAK